MKFLLWLLLSLGLTYSVYAQPTNNTHHLRAAVRKLVKSMSNDSTLDIKPVGLAGIPTAAYHHYLVLRKLASVEELRELTDSPYPIIRSAAFSQLIEIDSVQSIFKILKAHSQDTASFVLRSNCFVAHNRVGFYMYILTLSNWRRRNILAQNEEALYAIGAMIKN
ncbi:hypothetical protein [Hymenobacter lapidiphilus]|uniref:HEAT repeat domain-containing protein n=1 Tax=Hymenobacter lapidiphilus TaxID=2608003 RepID=A0A7Y7U4C9_9BACT|nr:hypothetical protein [Hymenobacter lapidiphilus]NVO30556.1 hypothetical protein [Hymenobacter lapidiphilus]